ncbi:MAG: CDC48 family AAA ATPase [Thermoprotei archaeon]
MGDNIIELRVTEALAKDVGRGIARMDSKAMKELGIETGDVVQITGRRKTFVKVLPAYVDDYGRGIIRLDSFTRNNAGIGLDDKVNVQRAEVKPAEKVSLAPTEPLQIIGVEEFLAQILAGRVLGRGDVVPITVMGRRISLVVNSTTPGGGAVIVSEGTKVELSEKAESVQNLPQVSYEDIGGMREVVQKVREMIELPLKHPELFERLGVEAPKGVLLFGPPGTGKTLLAKAVANETNAHFLSISGPEIMSKFYGESEQRLREIFEEAQKNAPSIVFIDELDSIAPKREEVTGEVERRVVAQLLTLMDGLQSRGKVVVIGATNRPNAIDPALRRPGRFDREIEIKVPDVEGRLEILQIHTRGMPLSKNVDLGKLAEVTHGFVGADLAALAKEAAMHSLRRILPEVDLNQEKIAADVLNKISVEMADFEEALKEVHPSAMREVLIEKPNVHWEDIGGLDGVKQELKEAVEWPLKYPELISTAKVNPPKGILMFGPPGTGKTLLAKALATESEANFIAIRGPELLSKWVGESEQAVREVFRKARQAAPSIVFFDEIDALAPSRGSGSDSNVTERVVSQLLTEMDGIVPLNNVTVVAATNRLDLVDNALLRPGRFDKVVEIPLPDEAARRQILEIHLRNKPLSKGVNIDKLARETSGMSGADIAGMVQAASMLAIRNFIDKHGSSYKKMLSDFVINESDFEQALSQVKSRLPRQNKTELTLTP